VQHDIDEAGMQQDTTRPSSIASCKLAPLDHSRHAHNPGSMLVCAYKHALSMQPLNKMQQKSSQHLEVQSVRKAQQYSKRHQPNKTLLLTKRCTCDKMRMLHKLRQCGETWKVRQAGHYQKHAGLVRQATQTSSMPAQRRRRRR